MHGDQHTNMKIKKMIFFLQFCFLRYMCSVTGMLTWKKLSIFTSVSKIRTFLCVHNMQQQQGNKWPEHEWFSKESKPTTIRAIESRYDTPQLKDEEKDERMIDPIHCNTCKTASPSSIIQLRFQYNGHVEPETENDYPAPRDLTGSRSREDNDWSAKSGEPAAGIINRVSPTPISPILYRRPKAQPRVSIQAVGV